MTRADLVFWLNDLREQDPVIGEAWEAMGAKVTREVKGSGNKKAVSRLVSFVDSAGVSHSLRGEQVGNGKINFEITTKKPDSTSHKFIADIFAVRGFIENFLKYTDKVVSSDDFEIPDKAQMFREKIEEVEGTGAPKVEEKKPTEEEAVPVPIIVNTSQGKRQLPVSEEGGKNIEKTEKPESNISSDLARFLSDRGIEDPQDILKMTGGIDLKHVEDQGVVEKIRKELGLDSNDEMIYPEITKVELDKGSNGARDGWVYFSEDKQDMRLRLIDFVKLIS